MDAGMTGRFENAASQDGEETTNQGMQKAPSKLEEKSKQSLLCSLQKEYTPVDTSVLSWTSDLQNSRIVSLYCSKLLNVGYLVQQP